MSDKHWKSIEESNRDVQDPEVLRVMLDETQAACKSAQEQVKKLKDFHHVGCPCNYDTRIALRESQAREAVVTAALRGLMARSGALSGNPAADNPAEAKARVALASPSDAAAKLLERVADWGKLTRLNEEWQGVEARLVADRDRWLRHCRLLLDGLATASIGDHPVRKVIDAARRDLEQHDAGRKP